MDFIALDLGFANIRLSCNNQLLFNEPNSIAYNEHHKVIALGNQAESLKGTNMVKKAQTINDIYIFINELFERFKLFRFFKKTTLLFSAPAFLSKELCLDIQNHIIHCGATHVEYEQQIWCGALGAHLNVEGPVYSCMMHIGYSSFDLALFSKGKIIQKENHKYGGKYIDTHIRNWLYKNYQLQISDKQLETLKYSIGQSVHVRQPKVTTIQGIDIHQQMKTLQLDENTFVNIFNSIIYQWVQCIYQFLKQIPAIAQQAIALRGIAICGGSAQFDHLNTAFHQQLNIPFYICQNASLTVLNGMEILLDRIEDHYYD